MAWVPGSRPLAVEEAAGLLEARGRGGRLVSGSEAGRKNSKGPGAFLGHSYLPPRQWALAQEGERAA